MQIAVTATGPSLDDQVEIRFGRASHYIFVDTESMHFDVIKNPNISAGGGAGIQSAQLMANHGVTHVLTGNCGPNAFSVFGAAGIKVIPGVSGTVRQVVEQFKTGSVIPADRANVESHFGMSLGGVGNMDGTDDPGMGTGAGRGMGGGRGMGMGGGRGGGRGMGMRGRRSGGFLRSTEINRGTGEIDRGNDFKKTPGYSPSVQAGEEKSRLLQKKRDLERQLREVEVRMDSRQRTGKSGIARVDASVCTGCGVCEDVCPAGAITVNENAVIDADACTGCGICIPECPVGAIALS